MTQLSHLPGLGDLTTEGVGYRVTEPVSVSTVRDLVRTKSFSRVEITDGTGGLARFSALYWHDGRPVVITGQIASN